jgi:hypothetical protein
MSSSVSSNTTNTTNIFLDEGFDEIEKIMKEEAQATLQKTSDQVKIAMKEQVDNCAKSATPYVTFTSKAAGSLISTQPVYLAFNASLDTFIEPIIESGMKKIGYKSVDKCVDTAAKKIIDQTIDSSVNSAKSSTSTVYDYIQIKFT